MTDTSFTGLQRKDTYKDILHIATNNVGLSGAYTTIYDGAGNATTMQVSTGGLKINNLSYPTADGSIGQFLKTDGAGNLSFATVAVGAGTLAALTDVSLAAPGNGQYLKYNGSAWINAALAGNISVFTNDSGYLTAQGNLTGPITSVGLATSVASQTGTGTKFVMDTSPTLVTPILGIAAATTINKLTVTAPATGSTLTIQDGFTLTANGNATVSGTHSGTSSGTNTGDQTNITGNAGTVTVAVDATNGTESLAYFLGTSGSLAPKTASTLTCNPSTGLITATSFAGALTGNVTGNCTGTSGSTTGNAATVTTNANLTGPITSSGNATAIASQTGTGTKFVVDNTPTLVTPVIGVATATSVNKVAITAPATSSTLTIQDGFTLTANGNATVSGTHSGTSSGTNTGDQTTVSGNAGTVTVSNDVANTTDYLFFNPTATGSLAPHTAASLTCNPSSGTITATTFVGALSGNATTSSSTTGNAATVTTNANLTGDVTSSGNATTYNNTVPVTKGGTNVTTMTTAYAPVCAGTTATGALQVASTGLSTSGWVLTSNGASALPSFQVAPGAGGGSNATTATVTDVTTNASFYPMFVPTHGGATQALDTSAGFSINPNTNAVTATTFIGALTGNVTGNCTGSSGSTTGNAATVTTTASAANTDFDIVFCAGAGSSSLLVDTATPAKYHPSTGTLTLTTFVGALTGNASGSSGSCTGNAGTVTVAVNSTNASYSPLFSTATSGSLSPQTAASYTFNPSTVTLSCTNFVGALSGASTSCSGNASTVTTNANLTGDVTSSGNATTYNNVVGPTKGGTGLSTLTTAYAPVCAGTVATGNLQVASTGLSTAGYVLTSTGASSLPTFQAAAGGASLGLIVAIAAQQFCA